MRRYVVFGVLVGCYPQGDVPLGGEGTQAIINGQVDEGHGYVVGVGNQNGPFCTGTLISGRTVISAGHCFGGVSRVWFGTNATMPINTTTEIRHPGFDNFSLSNDLMLIQLAADAPVPPAPLLRETMTNTPAFIGPDYTWVGYGDDELGNSGTRRVVPFPIDVVGPATVGGMAGEIDASMFYFQVSNVNTCFGDSGGPGLIVRGGVERHAGVTSYGDSSCAFDGVAARTDQPVIDDFIQAHIDEFEGTDPCRNNGVCEESCNTGGMVRDPDCHELHCGADGLCATACALPLDPDCATGVDHCGLDGVCDPGCTSADPDCDALPDAGPVDVTDAGTVDPADASLPGVDAGPVAVDAGGDAVDAGLNQAVDAAPEDDSEEGGCGCRQTPRGGSVMVMLLAIAAVTRRRRRAGAPA